MTSLSVPIPLAMVDFVGPALARLGYLYPDVLFAFSGNAISVEGARKISEDGFRKEVLYAVYREKIYTETLGMRRSLIATVSEK